MNKRMPAPCLLAFCITTAHTSLNMAPGLWEITMKSEIQGMPDGMGMPATTMTQWNYRYSGQQAHRPAAGSEMRNEGLQASGKYRELAFGMLGARGNQWLEKHPL